MKSTNVKIHKSMLYRSLLLVIAILAPVVASLTLFSSDHTLQTVEAEQIGECYYTYSPEHFQKSRGESDAVLLNFYATWCASCNQFEPTIKNVMEEIGYSRNVRAYRVNFGDNSENDYGKELAKEYGVTMQTTTVILNGDGEVFKTYFTPVPESELRESLMAATLTTQPRD
jgi:thiol-disulfide isomerase/thioredoxin